MREESDCQISGVLADRIPSLWLQLEPFVIQALDHSEGEYLPEDIRDCLMDMLMQLWLVADAEGIRGVIITELQNYPRKKICYVVAVAGIGLDDWDHAIELIEGWAFEMGADIMRTKARPGWRPYAKKYGYELAYHAYSKPMRVSNEDTH